MNIWYVVAKIDDSKYGRTSVCRETFPTFERADYTRNCLQEYYDERLVVLKRTCEILN